MAHLPQAPAYPGWETVKHIGSGSYGNVYEIQRDVYGDMEKAALKVINLPYSDSEIDYLRGSGMDDASILQSIRHQVGDIANEYKLMAQMRGCPNVVRCDDFQDHQHRDGLGWDIYIKMELLNPVLKCLDRVQTEAQIIRMGKDLCNALIACQQKNIIHRDIKPQNIFISDNGEFKLGDFGIARTMERTTHATAGIGTYSYMAPEVIKGESYGKTADIYSLGLVLYWFLNERRGPFMPLPPAVPTHGDDERAKTRRFSGEPLPAPKNGSNLLKQVVLKACSFDSKDRYQTAKEFLVALCEAETCPTAAASQEAATSVDDVTVRVRQAQISLDYVPKTAVTDYPAYVTVSNVSNESQDNIPSETDKADAEQAASQLENIFLPVFLTIFFIVFLILLISH